MKSYALLIVLASLGSAASLRAQPSKPAAPEPAQPGVAEIEALVPPRQIEFKVSDEASTLLLPIADPKLLEQRFVAVVRLELPEGSVSSEIGTDLDSHPAALRLRTPGAAERRNFRSHAERGTSGG